MIQVKAKVLDNVAVAAGYYKMSLEAPRVAQEARPGQFITIRCAEGPIPLLRRPFSIHRTQGRCIEILYKVVGKGTELLSRKKPGEKLDILGPLGNGFTLPQAAHELSNELSKPALEIYSNAGLESRIAIVAGGMGVAPFVALAEEIIRVLGIGYRVSGKRLETRNADITVLIGAKTKKSLLCEKEFKALGCKVEVATEDGSKGKKGLATDLLKGFLRNPKPETRNPLIYACGPRPMLKEVAGIARRKGISCEVSLEEHMGCGVGTCLGCVVKTKADIYKRVCKEGPVFDAEEVVW